MTHRWERIEELMVASATDDLQQVGEVTPILVAFAGDEQRLWAFLRPFAKGDHAQPIIELLALAMPLDADRLAFAITGRLTSLDDPIPPVTEDADLRQRALIVEYVEGAGGSLRQDSVIHPFDVVGERVRWQPSVAQQHGEGWLRDVLGCAVAHRGQLVATTSDRDIRRQAQRCLALGHELYLGEATAERLHLTPAATGRDGQAPRR